ncbi:MAG TPA: methyl-accepting chemotaxis protein [Candidatus Wunengus sp. YC60]|uniref:methyl-accepting chemotaxis protein n=1 Tax=Candidatus Wunengus sp. YC60 TaxID=3367697 RepID=UPI00402899DC
MANFISKSLKGKLILLLLAVSLVPIAIIGYMSYLSGKTTIQRQFLDSLTTIVESKETAITLYLKSKTGKVLDFSSDGLIRDSLEKINQKSPDTKRLSEDLNKHILENKKPLDPDCYDISILNLDGKVVTSTDKDKIGSDKSNDDYFIEGKKDIHVKSVHHSETTGKDFIAVSVPILSMTTKELIGVIVNRYEIKALNEITTNRKGMGQTGEVYIVDKDGYMITESRFIGDATLKQKVDTEPIKLFHNQKKSTTGIYPDYRGIPVVGASAGNELDKAFGLGWTVLAEIDVAEAFAPVKTVGLRIIWTGLVVGLFVALIAYFSARQIAGPVRRISEQLVRVSSGDLSINVPIHNRQDEVGILARTVRAMVEKLKAQTRDIMGVINVLASSSNQIATTTVQLASGAEETAVAVTETTTTVEEVKQTANVSSQKARHVSALAQNAVQVSQTGAKSVNETIEGINKLKEQMEYIAETIVKLSEHNQAIGEIIATVDDLAEQSNLLAVNAAIEAAKAGEHGKGFVVVAQEIKSHAEQSKQATKQVRTILNDIQKASSTAVMATEKGSKAVDATVKQSAGTGDAIRELSRNIAEAAQAVTQIAASSQQELVGMDQVAMAMTNIKQATAQNAASTKQVESTVRSLQELGQKLKALVEYYKI